MSGYRLFEYAHNALKYNVEDYILKPIDNTELNNRLSELAQDVRREKKGVEAPIPTDNNGYRRFFLNRVVEDLAGGDASIEAIHSAYGIDFKPGYFQAVCVALDMPAPQAEMIETGATMKKLASALERALSKSCVEVLLDVDGNRLLSGFNYLESEADGVRRGVAEFFDYARELVNLFVSARITVGVGEAFRTPEGLKQSKDQAQCAIWARISLGLDRVIEYARLEQNGAAVSAEARRACSGGSTAPASAGTPGILRRGGEIFALVRGASTPRKPATCARTS